MSNINKSYLQIIRSTGIFGGSQIITILIGIIRNKILAILLGTTGIGLISMYQNIQDLVKSVSSFGFETTGVREIASIRAEEDKQRLMENISLIDKWSAVFAIFGALLCILGCYPLSIWAFGDASHALQIALLAIPLFFTILAAGQTVVLHGLRRITYMVKSTIIWNTGGLIISIPLYYYFRLNGIIPVFIAVSIGMYLSTLYYRKKLKTDTASISFTEALIKGKNMLRIGFFIVISSILTSISFFILRAFINQNIGLESVGLFQSAWTITNVYLMLVLKSMGSDYYPRLCGIITDNNKSRQLINEQTYIVLIVSIPLIILLLTCSGFILSILYSSDFSGAGAILNWQVAGTFFKVISWPLGFILLAKGKGKLFLASEIISLSVYLGTAYTLFPFFGLEAIGIAFLVQYIIYLPVVYILGKRLCNFNWTTQNIQLTLVSLVLIVLTFSFTQLYPAYRIIAGIPFFIISLVYSLFNLNKVFPLTLLNDFFRKKK